MTTVKHNFDLHEQYEANQCDDFIYCVLVLYLSKYLHIEVSNSMLDSHRQIYPRVRD